MMSPAMVDALKSAKKCPFCGNDKLRVAIRSFPNSNRASGDIDYHFYVYCECGATGPDSLRKFPKNSKHRETARNDTGHIYDAVRLWNVRGLYDDVSEEVSLDGLALDGSFGVDDAETATPVEESKDDFVKSLSELEGVFENPDDSNKDSAAVDVKVPAETSVVDTPDVSSNGSDSFQPVTPIAVSDSSETLEKEEVSAGEKEEDALDSLLGLFDKNDSVEDGGSIKSEKVTDIYDDSDFF